MVEELHQPKVTFAEIGRLNAMNQNCNLKEICRLKAMK